MAFSDGDWTALLTEVGDDGTVDGLRTFVTTYAESMAAQVTDSTTYGPLVTYQFGRLKGIELLMGTVRTKVTFSEGDLRVQLSDLLANLLNMKKEAQQALDDLTVAVQGAGTGLRIGVGNLAATGEVSTAAGTPNPNDPYYRGEPFRYYPVTTR